MLTKLIRIPLIVLCLLGAAFFMMPVLGGWFHVGMWLPALALVLIAVILAFRGVFTGILKLLVRITAILLAAGAVLSCVLFIMMGLAASKAPPDNTAATVIVLGCKVEGDTPSLMLQNRIDAAYQYLNDHPEAVCIASGGQGPDENLTEALAIYDVLVQKGIDGSRILLEEDSHSTHDNIQFSAALIEKHNLPTTVVVVSDNFHQYRAALFAKRNGLEPYAYGCASPWDFRAGYWFREAVAIVHAWVFGN